MNNYLLSSAIGDIAGSIFHETSHSAMQCDEVKVFSSNVHITDNIVSTYACAEALINDLDIFSNLRERGEQHEPTNLRFKLKKILGYHHDATNRRYGNGAAMRSCVAGWLARSKEDCVNLATQIASPSHYQSERRCAIISAYTIFLLNQGCNKEDIQKEILEKYYRNYADKTYWYYHDVDTFDFTCTDSIAPAIICFLKSKDYTESLKLVLSLGRKAYTLAPIVGSMAYTYYKEIPDSLIDNALKMLPEWMIKTNNDFDLRVNSK